MFELVRQDLRRYFQMDLDDGGRGGARGFFQKLRLILTSPGIQCVLVHRFGAWVYGMSLFWPARVPLKVMYRLAAAACSLAWGVHIDVRAKIGGGLYLGHAYGILLGPVAMGRDCSIGQNVTIGRRADGSKAVPRIGDRVWIGISSVVFGNITVGDGVTIGPLTVVGRSLPPRVLVGGNPLRILRTAYDNSGEVYGRNEEPQPDVYEPIDTAALPHSRVTE
jgi:serine O-acetyltransferase